MPSSSSETSTNGVAAGEVCGVASDVTSGVGCASGCDSWAVGASPPLSGEGWTLG